MKVGREQTGKLLFLVLLLVVGATFYFFGGGLGPGDATGFTGSASGKLPDLARLDPTLHMAELERLRGVEYTGDDRDLFHYVEAAPPPLPHPPAPSTGPAGRGNLPGGRGGMGNGPAMPAGPIGPPPLPLQFYGTATPSAGGVEKVFLRLADQVFVVSEGETVDKRYLVEKINKLSVRVKDLQTGAEQDLPLYQG